MAADRLLPLAEPWLGTLADRGLRRGIHVSVLAPTGGGGLSVAWHLIARATQQGYWVGVVGVDDPGVLAMHEYGVDLRRVLFIPRPRDAWAEVAADLIEGVDVVVVRAPGRPAAAVARRLTARAREQRVVLVSVAEPHARWTQSSDVVVSVRSASWRPAPRVMTRDMVLDVGGRLVGPTSREVRMSLPDAAEWVA